MIKNKYSVSSKISYRQQEPTILTPITMMNRKRIRDSNENPMIANKCPKLEGTKYYHNAISQKRKVHSQLLHNNNFENKRYRYHVVGKYNHNINHPMARPSVQGDKIIIPFCSRIIIQKVKMLKNAQDWKAMIHLLELNHSCCKKNHKNNKKLLELAIYESIKNQFLKDLATLATYQTMKDIVQQYDTTTMPTVSNLVLFLPRDGSALERKLNFVNQFACILQPNISNIENTKLYYRTKLAELSAFYYVQNDNNNSNSNSDSDSDSDKHDNCRK